MIFGKFAFCEFEAAGEDRKQNSERQQITMTLPMVAPSI